jgi:hypothetical protein
MNLLHGQGVIFFPGGIPNQMHRGNELVYRKIILQPMEKFFLVPRPVNGSGMDIVPFDFAAKGGQGNLQEPGRPGFVPSQLGQGPGDVLFFHMGQGK